MAFVLLLGIPALHPHAARVARRMLDMLRSQLSANSCNAAPCARRRVASFCCAGVWKGVGPWPSTGLGAAPAICGAGADKIALDVGQPAENRQHQAPGAGAGLDPRLRAKSELRLGVHDRLTMANRSKVLRAGGQCASP
jgi:hypothetical protein